MRNISDYDTLLMFAVDNCGIAVVKRLLSEKGVDINATNYDDKTALDIAKEGTKWAMVQEIVLYSMGDHLKEKAKEKIYELEKTKGIIQQWFAVCDDKNIMEGICNGVKTLIRNKLPISDEMLLIAFEWELKQLKETSNEANPLNTSLYKVMKETLNESLNIPLNKRNWLWFKEYLFHSLIWFKRLNETQLLYDDLNELIAGKLQVQKEFLKGSIDVMEDEKANGEIMETWDKLKHYREFRMEMDSEQGLRQDLYPLLSFPTRSIFDEKHLMDIKLKTNFDALHHNDVHSYLAQLLTTAHALNDVFHENMTQIYDKDIKNGILRYQRGSVKGLARSQAKAETDYASFSFPTTAKILDFIRCSLTYSSPKHLNAGINQLKAAVDSQKYNIKKILRIKNMFLQHRRDNNENKWDLYKYADIKVNVLLEYENRSMIVEVQFLLDFMLTAKKMGHGLYEIARNKEFMDNVDRLKHIQYQDLDQLLANAVLRDDYKELALLMFNHTVAIPKFPNLFVESIQNGSKKAFKLLHHCAMYELERNTNDEIEKAFYDKLTIRDRKNGINASFIALEKGYYRILKELLKFENMDVNIRFIHYSAQSLLCLAIKQGADDSIHLLLNDKRLNREQAVEDIKNKFIMAVKLCSVVTVKRFYDMIPELDVNKPQRRRNTYLHYVSENKKDCLEILRWLLSFKHIDVDELNEAGHTPWFYALSCGNIQVAKELYQRYSAMDASKHIDFKRYNAMDIAKRKNNPQLIEWVASLPLND